MSADPSNLLTLMVWMLGTAAVVRIVGIVVVRRLQASAAIIDPAKRGRS